VNQTLSRASNTVLGPGDITFAFVVWFRPDNIAGPNQAILSKWGASGNNREYKLDLSSTVLAWNVSGDGTVPDTTTVAVAPTGGFKNGAWYMAICFHDHFNNEIGILLNDDKETRSAHSTGVHQGSTDFVLANADESLNFEGAIASVGS
jgi:hypothetical protein